MIPWYFHVIQGAQPFQMSTNIKQENILNFSETDTNNTTGPFD